jgi:hypothetical protein
MAITANNCGYLSHLIYRMALLFRANYYAIRGGLGVTGHFEETVKLSRLSLIRKHSLLN